ncbi:sigma 54-interacting transcriptional regulator [Neptuniibacter sp. CAU 1671]|uniref:sigma-54-dependent Fis family transcriptional regulator n=1 Tax=Neptuniibacter sp. CAU 1671 TaxID=3032593 RepID=UPI0023DC36C3|nr:sigma 54-interacting transcriptional regulator [Neptuniibacter sp. CAU 1671]MDF2182823.1 sigma 54-interacting transcriptional regulator [Neptuniibacter sp. CAU 1671]
MRLKNKDLLACAESTIEQARMLLSDLETVLFITDRNALNLEIVGDPRTLEDAWGVGLMPGGGWLEIMSGSNAVGTAIANNMPTQVHGVEHFCEGFKPWSCTATCIYDPYDGQRLGAIDLSGLTKTFDRFHIPLVVSWANVIQAQLAMLNSERWSMVEQAVQADSRNNSRNDFLLLDSQGRFIRTNNTTSKAIQRYFPDFKPGSTFRIPMDRFGGEQTELTTLSADWLQEEWVHPIRNGKEGGEIVGFKINFPSHIRRSASKTTVSRDVSFGSGDSDNPNSALNPELSKEAAKAKTAAKTPLPILLLGETGCGKEYFAKAIHAETRNPDGPFIDLNCGSFSRDLLNSELFGHVEGAFTGAKKGGMIGKIEAANGGTLFLDEIGEMPLDIQPLFLRVLQEKQIYRVGDVKPRSVDFKLVAATNVDLKQAVAEGRFRKDLYYRISSVVVELKPLCERKAEIPQLVESILNRISEEHHLERKQVSADLLLKLTHFNWPGNIRELSNVLEFMAFMSDSEVLDVQHLPDEYQSEQLAQPLKLAASAGQPLSLEEAEKLAIESAIESTRNNLTQAAKQLGIAKSTLYQKIKKYDIAC